MQFRANASAVPPLIIQRATVLTTADAGMPASRVSHTDRPAMAPALAARDADLNELAVEIWSMIKHQLTVDLDRQGYW